MTATNGLVFGLLIGFVLGLLVAMAYHAARAPKVDCTSHKLTAVNVSRTGVQCPDCGTPVDVMRSVGTADARRLLLEPCGHDVNAEKMWPR